ncbi:MAG TPA: EAL domain-containing protein [Steroidobacteraceae bacterium]|jgi:diguanylate cyclase (GGDEF)-like protein/PAS domain S-box-containing protein|nr:EAL domain-containing protein [Steroidobacteraceae bacterium]
MYVTAASFKFRYAGGAFLVGLLAAGAIAGLLLARHAADTGSLSTLAEHAARERVDPELGARARSIAAHAADSITGAVRAGDASGTARRLQPFVDDATVSALTVTSRSGQTLFSWQRGFPPQPGALSTRAEAPVRTFVDISGALTPETLASVTVVLDQAAPVPALTLAGRLQAATAQRTRLTWWVALALAAAGAVAAAALLWRAINYLQRPVGSLIRSAERIGQGDYTRPFEVVKQEALADLQQALEHMRGRLRQTTINKNYLHSVLNSMTDAVFVTSPDGIIKVANTASCKLLAYSEEELLGKSILVVLEERERADFDLQQASQETRETLVRTRSGQTIPVSFTGSRIDSDDPQFQGNIFVARNITDRKRAERRIRYLARYDALTKIPNRMQFHHVLQQTIARALRAGQVVAVLYLDMDRFKEVNDTFGHGAGDRVLEVLAERLTRAVPKETVVGRLAGDEFALFVEGLPADADNRGPIAQMARSLLTEVSRPFQLNQHEVFLTASVGIAFCPRDAENVIDLIRNADAAMYYSKQNGGNTFAFYSPEMNAAAVERLMLKSKLRRALERDELEIRYQPKVDLRTGRIIGAEALLRWRLPGHGDISPAHFIPLAEETNLILDIGEWVLNRVCLDYRQMRAEGSDPGRISLNLSLKQLRQASFILRCRSVFRRHHVSPTAFELEITETTLMADPQRTVRLLDELYAMGLHLSIDDFGTGYSSLSALQQFPIGTLKIDQSFVRDATDDAGDATIVRTIIEMGRSLGMEVIAEGVESRRQLQFLRSNACHYGQGRLFGEPCTAQELLALLAAGPGGAAPFAHLLREADEATSRSA